MLVFGVFAATSWTKVFSAIAVYRVCMCVWVSDGLLDCLLCGSVARFSLLFHIVFAQLHSSEEEKHYGVTKCPCCTWRWLILYTSWCCSPAYIFTLSWKVRGCQVILWVSFKSLYFFLILHCYVSGGRGRDENIVLTFTFRIFWRFKRGLFGTKIRKQNKQQVVVLFCFCFFLFCFFWLRNFILFFLTVCCVNDAFVNN